MQAISPTADMDMIRDNAASARKLGDLKMKSFAMAKASPEKIAEIAQDFEAQFIASMMEHMFSGLETDGPLGGGEAESTYRSLMVDQYGKLIAKSGGIGVADHVQREMLRMQEIGA